MRRRPTGPGIAGLDLLLVGLVVVFGAVTLGAGLLGRTLLIDVNLLTQFQPWKALRGTSIDTTNICRSDTVDFFMPGIAEIRRALFAGSYPAWSPYGVGGTPLGTPNYGQLSPLSLPYYVMPLWLAPAFVKLGQLVAVLLGSVLFLRRLGSSLAAGLLAGLVFFTSGFMVSWTNWPQTQVAALVPLLFWAAERLAQQRQLRYAVPLALVVTAMVLGGFPAVTGMALYLAAVYFVVRLVVLNRGAPRRIGHGVVSAVVGLGLAGMLSAFQLLPFVAQLAGVDLSYRDEVLGSHSPFDSLVTLVAADAQGTCVGGAWTSTVIPIESIAFVGAGAVVLALVAVAWPPARTGRAAPRGVVAVMALAAAMIVVVGWVGGPLLVAVQALPVFSNNPIGRIRSLLGFVLAVLAGLGFDRLVRAVEHQPPDTDTDTDAATGRRGRRGRLVRPVLVMLVTLAFGGAVAVSARRAAVAAQAEDVLLASLRLPSVILVATVLLVVVVWWGQRHRGAARLRWAGTAAVAVLVVAQGARFAHSDLGDSDRDSFYPVTSTHAFLQASLGAERFSGADLVGLPATAPFYEIRSPTGHQFTPPTWWDLLLAADPRARVSATYSGFTSTTFGTTTSVGHAPLLDQLSVRYWLAPDDQASGTVAPPSGRTSVTTVRSGQTVSCQIPSGPLRAAVVDVGAAVPAPRTGPAPTMSVVLHTPSGDLTGARYLGTGLAAAGPLAIPVPGEDLARGGALTAYLTITGLDQGLPLGSDGTNPVCGTVAPAADGLKLVHAAPGAVVYQRLSSLPRVRWASASRVVTDVTERVTALTAGVGADTVLLGSPGPPAAGKPATVQVTADGGDTVAATVTAQGNGYLVVADSMQQQGWSATLDGRPADLVPANHAFVAVAVPAGRHDVRVHYAVPGLQAGGLTSLAGLVGVAGILLWPRFRSAARRRRSDRSTPRGRYSERVLRERSVGEAGRPGAVSQRGGDAAPRARVDPPRHPGHRRDRHPHHRRRVHRRDRRRRPRPRGAAHRAARPQPWPGSLLPRRRPDGTGSRCRHRRQHRRRQPVPAGADRRPCPADPAG